jgi:uncharacterized protein YeaO (DUF488 family)
MKMSSINIKRAYEKSSKDDGFRVLIDRLWPRGISKKEAKIDYWAKEIAPSTELREWFSHDPEKWSEFKKRYFKELGKHPEEISFLIKKAGENKVTLVFGSKEKKFNNAAALVEYLENISERKGAKKQNS